jgi:hypothetical protein
MACQHLPAKDSQVGLAQRGWPLRSFQWGARLPAAFLAVVAVACSPLFGALLPATPTPVPPSAAVTTTPTSTTAPTSTPTEPPTATATPDQTTIAQTENAATQAAAAELIEPDLQAYGLSTRRGALGWLHRRVDLSVTEYQGYEIVSDYPDLNVADFVVQADITWNTSSGLAGCGFAVRAAPGLKTQFGYQLLTVRLSGAPLWFFVLFTGGTAGGWISSGDAPTLDIGLDSTNTIAIVGIGSEFSFFVNGVLNGHATDADLREGTVAFLARQESGSTRCTFDNAWLWVLTPGSGIQA